VGLALVGQLAMQSAKKEGWRKAPANVWGLLRHGPPDSAKPKTTSK